MKALSHLQLAEIPLPPGEEWMHSAAVWRFVRLHSGAAYWLGKGENRPLSEGEVLVIAPQVQGVIRGSQLGEAILHGFAFEPELLYGFFTMAERARLEAAAVEARQLRLLPSTHPVSQNFAAMVGQDSGENSIARRVLALGLVSTVFQDELAQAMPVTSTLSTSAAHRFEAIVVHMPDTELAHHTPEELAKLCGCSARHFNRLFRQRFGVSARERQTELRLLKARQLLAEKDDKIVHIALEAGYQNLSIFNTLFKKRFSCTPSEWRRKANKAFVQARAVALAVMTWFAALGWAQAETSKSEPQFAPLDPVTGGLVVEAKTNSVTQTLTDQVAAAKAKGERLFRVTGYELDGNTLLPPEAYEPILQDHTGEEVTFATIKSCIANLTIAYRTRGFSTVALSLPPQSLTNGIVKIKVTEGIITEVKVTGNRFFSTRNVLRTLPGLRTNEVLNSILLQSQLDRANGNRDRQIYPVVAPGPEPGTSVLELRVKDQRPFHARSELNNNNTPGSPVLRMNLSASYDNLWQREHQVGVQYSLTPEALKADHYKTYLDAPLIANYSIFYRFPLGPVNGEPRDPEQSGGKFGYDEATRKFNLPPNTGRTEVNVYASRSASDTDSKLSKYSLTPATLPASGGLQVSDKLFDRTLSENENLGLRLTKPLPTVEKVQSTVSAGVDFKSYRSLSVQDRVFNAVVYVPEVGNSGPPFIEFPSPPTQSRRETLTGLRYLPLSAGFNAARPDDEGVTSYNLSGSFNFAGTFGGKKDFQAVSLQPETTGNYVILSSGLSRQQKLEGGWGFLVRADGQWASEPLISNEQYGLGGEAGVRGYNEGEQYGDTGWRFTFEPHTPDFELGLVDGTEPMQARFFSFFDYGERYLLGSRLSQPQRANLAGAGAGISASIGDNLDMRFQLACALLDSPALHTASQFPNSTIRAGDWRLTFSVGARF